jgi:hypothetical protein
MKEFPTATCVMVFVGLTQHGDARNVKPYNYEGSM